MVNVFIYYKFGFTKDESHDLLKKAVQDLYDIPENELEVSIMDRGKPFFTFHPEVHFSISHTNDLWVCAISSDQIGCDVQYHKTAGRRNTETLYKIAQRYFSPEETLAVQKADNTEKIFYDIWSRKEASVKLTGEGISKGFKVVFSEELPDRNAIIPMEERNKKSQVGTISYLPASFGIVCAQVAITSILSL